MNTIIKLALVGVAMTLLSGCATNSPTESDFGNSVRAMVSAQTMNPAPDLNQPEVSDGQRLEKVIEAYRETSGAERSTIRDKVYVGVQ